MALADLGGLGAREGPPVFYNWTASSMVPALLPWLVILGLLALKPNRGAQAWWIVVPLGAVLVLGSLVAPSLSGVTSELLGLFLDVFIALAFGLAAVWLLAPVLSRSHRVLTFLCLLLALGGASLLTYVFRQDWGGEPAQVAGGMMMLAVGIPVMALALSLAGLCCRRQYRPARLTVWLGVWLAAAWTIIVTPVFLIAVVASSGRVPWASLFGGALVIAAACFVTALPFLFLAFTNTFYRERLKRLLHLTASEAPPPMMDSAAVPGPAV